MKKRYMMNFIKIIIFALMINIIAPITIRAKENDNVELYLAGYNSEDLTEEIVNNAEVTEEMIKIASEKKEYEIETNEYDILVEVKNSPMKTKKLEKKLNSTIEETILERANLPEETLYKLGYTDHQIKILKEYDGSPIEDNPQLRSAAGAIGSDFHLVKRSSKGMTVLLNWRWKTLPFTPGLSDNFGCGWYNISSSGTRYGEYNSKTWPNNFMVVHPLTGNNIYLREYNAGEQYNRVYKMPTYWNSDAKASYGVKSGRVMTSIVSSTNSVKELAFLYNYAESYINGVDIGLSFSGHGVSGSFSLKYGYRLIMNRHLALGQTGGAKYIGTNY